MFFIKTVFAFVLLATVTIAQVNGEDTTDAKRQISKQITINELKKIQESDEIFLNINYAGIVKTTVVAFYYNNEFYFPFKEICDNLEIFNKIENYKISGFLNNQSNSYVISFNPNVVVLSDTLRNFVFSDYLKSDFDYYFNAQFFKNIFNLEIITDFSNLTSTLQSKELMPIFQRVQREKSYDIFAKKSKAGTAELLYPRKRKMLGGAIVDYNFGYSVGEKQPLNSFYNFKLGGELLGGDGQISTYGNVDVQGRTYNSFDYLWRYVFDKNKYLRTISAGKISLNGLYSVNYSGVKISNNQVEPRRTYATHRVYEKTKANWSVEVYISNQLIAVTKADAVGDFYFDMPLSYGTTLLEIKYYGPGGEYYEQTRLYQTPYYLLRPNEFTYFINYGIIENLNSNVASVSGGYGITEWLTTELGYQYLEDDITENIFYNSTTARLFGEYLFNVTIAPQAYYKFSADVLYFSQSSFGIQYKRFESNGVMNPSSLLDDIGANFFVPFRFTNSQINLKGSYNYASNNNLELFDYTLGTSLSLDGFNPSLTYNYVKSVNSNSIVTRKFIDLGLSYFLGSVFGFGKILSGNLFTFRSYYDIKNNNFENYSIGLSTTIKRDSRLQFTHTYNFNTDESSFQLQLIVYLSDVQVNSTISNSGFRLGALGSLTYDGVANEVRGFNRAQVGRSTAAFRFFIDSNGNNILDADEEIIKGGNVLMGTSVIEREENGIIRARELDPYTIYTVNIDESSIRNPLLVPGIKRFSFVADPNTVKNIEIPFYIAGEVDGKVIRKVGSGESSVGGIKIHIKNISDNSIETVTTFSDGTYYYFGLRPGKYIAYVDEEQLKIIGIKNIISPVEFTVDANEYGDIIMNIDFILE